MSTITPYIEEFLKHAFSSNKNKSKNTLVSYKQKIEEFDEIISSIKGEDFKTTDLCFEDLQEYVDILGEEKKDGGKGNSPSSVRNKYITIQIFLKFLRKRKLTSGDITKDEDGDGVELPKVDKNEVKYLELNDFNRIIEKLKWIPSSKNNAFDGEFITKRNSTLFLVSFTTGLRRFELVSLKWDNVIGDLIVIRGKGNKERTVPLHPLAQEGIKEWKEYLDKRITKKDDEELKNFDLSLVFPSNRGSVISDSTYWDIIEKCFNLAYLGRYLTDENGDYILDKNNNKILNPKRLKPHSIRKGFASLLNDNGVTTLTLQNFLGHADPSTTARYVKVSNNTKRNIVNNIEINNAEKVNQSRKEGNQ